MVIKETKEKPASKKASKKKAEKKEPTVRSDRISYPCHWHDNVKKLAQEKGISQRQIYQIVLREFLLKHELLPSNNNTRS